jgi:hypothetical protein
MSRLDAAAGRFNAALEMIAKSASAQTPSRDSLDDTALRLAAMTEERDRLRARVEELEEEARALNGITHDVEGRLDGAIAEIRAALGR